MTTTKRTLDEFRGMHFSGAEIVKCWDAYYASESIADITFAKNVENGLWEDAYICNNAQPADVRSVEMIRSAARNTMVTNEFENISTAGEMLVRLRIPQVPDPIDERGIVRPGDLVRYQMQGDVVGFLYGVAGQDLCEPSSKWTRAIWGGQSSVDGHWTKHSEVCRNGEWLPVTGQVFDGGGDDGD